MEERAWATAWLNPRGCGAPTDRLERSSAPPHNVLESMPGQMSAALPRPLPSRRIPGLNTAIDITHLSKSCTLPSRDHSSCRYRTRNRQRCRDRRTPRPYQGSRQVSSATPHPAYMSCGSCALRACVSRLMISGRVIPRSGACPNCRSTLSKSIGPSQAASRPTARVARS